MGLWAGVSSSAIANTDIGIAQGGCSSDTDSTCKFLSQDSVLSKVKGLTDMLHVASRPVCNNAACCFQACLQHTASSSGGHANADTDKEAHTGRSLVFFLFVLCNLNSQYSFKLCTVFLLTQVQAQVLAR